MTIKSIETAYEEIFDFLDEVDSHPLSAQISLPVPDLMDNVWVDKYFVYEDVSIGSKHIAYSPDWIFTFENEKMIYHQQIKTNDQIVEYKISSDADETYKILPKYIEYYQKVKNLRSVELNKQRIIIDQYLLVFKEIIPQEIILYYTETSTQLRQWLI